MCAATGVHRPKLKVSTPSRAARSMNRQYSSMFADVLLNSRSELAQVISNSAPQRKPHPAAIGVPSSHAHANHTSSANSVAIAAKKSFRAPACRGPACDGRIPSRTSPSDHVRSELQRLPSRVVAPGFLLWTEDLPRARLSHPTPGASSRLPFDAKLACRETALFDSAFPAIGNRRHRPAQMRPGQALRLPRACPLVRRS